MSIATPEVLTVSHVETKQLPSTDANVFDFIFSNPFTKDSRLVKEMWKPYGDRHLQRIPISTPSFTEGSTGATISWGRLKADSLKVASSLVHGSLQLRPAPLSSSKPDVNNGAVVSPIVLLHLPNCIPFCVLTFGILASGLTWTAANPALTPGELAHILSLSKPAAIVTTAGAVPTWQAAFDLLAPEVRSELGYDRKGNVFVVDMEADDYGSSMSSVAATSETRIGSWTVRDWKTLLPAKVAPFSPPRYTAQEASLRAALIFWSSGTSGKSKGVVLTQRAATTAAIGAWFSNDWVDGERFMGLPPYYHIYGFANVLLPAAYCGAHVVNISKFDPATYLRLTEQSRATQLHIAPPVAVLFANSPLATDVDLSSVKAATSGGAPLGPEVIKAVYKRLGILIHMGYGLSETSGVTAQLADTWADLEPLLGTSGTAYPGTELSIASTEDGKIVPLGAEGEILIRAATNLISYLNNPAATKEAINKDGWFCTGDVGKLDAHGRLTITDRLKELIKVKGFQCSPAELEDGLCGSPFVADAGVTGIYYEDEATEYPRAYVVPKDKSILQGGKKAEEFAHQVRKYIEGSYVHYKWLRGGVTIVEQIPKNPSGKLLRRLLKDTKGIFVEVYPRKIRAKL